MKTYILFFLILIPLNVGASEYNEIIPDYSFEKMEEISGYSNFKEIVSSVENGDFFVSNNLFDKILNYFSGELKNSLGYIAYIVGFALLSGCVRAVCVKTDKGIDSLLFTVTYCVICVFVLGVLKNAAETSKNLADDVDAFVKMSIPAYIGIVSAFNPLKNPANLEGIFLVMVNIVSSFAGKIMINVLFYLGILYIINYMSTDIKVSKLIEFVKQALFWTLGFILTVFAGVTGLSGINAVAVSYAGIRTVKYTIGHSVPVIGSFLAESSDLLFASAKVFKNAFGTASIVIIFLICIFPILKLFVAGMLLKVAAGISEPFCDKRICDCIAAIGQAIIYMMVCLILLALMFVLSFATVLFIGMGG